MHEKALMDDLIREIEATARAEEAERVLAVRVRLGALSHFTPAHFREHFADAARGTVAEGAEVTATVAGAPTDPHAASVVLEEIEVEVGGSAS